MLGVNQTLSPAGASVSLFRLNLCLPLSSESVSFERFLMRCRYRNKRSLGGRAMAKTSNILAALKSFKEQVSSISQRGELERPIEYLRGRDTLVVTKVDRLARSTN